MAYHKFNAYNMDTHSNLLKDNMINILYSLWESMSFPFTFFNPKKRQEEKHVIVIDKMQYICSTNQV